MLCQILFTRDMKFEEHFGVLGISDIVGGMRLQPHA